MKVFKDIKVNRKIAGVLRVVGFLLSYYAPKFEFDWEQMKQGLAAGLIVGLIWSAIRYYKHGEKGILKSQSEMAYIFVYLLYFLGGYAFGYLIFKILLSSLS